MSNLVVDLTLRLRNELSKGIGAARTDMRGLRDEASKLGQTKGGDKLSTDLKKVEGAASAARRDIAGMRAEAARIGQASGAKQLARDLAGVGAAADRSARSVERIRRAGANIAAGRPVAGPAGGGASGSRGGGITAVGAGALGAVGGVLAARTAIRRTVGEAITFEKAMAEVKKKVDAPSPAAFERLEQVIKRTGVELGIPQEQVAQLTAEAGASGIAFGDLARFVRLAAKASVGWDITPQEAAQKLAEIKAATGNTIGEMETLADKINALGDNSAAKEKDIVEMFQRSGAAAKEAGVSYDTTLATLTAVRSAGMQPEVAARWFTAFAGGLRTIEDGTKKAKEGLKMLGLDAGTVAKGMKRDAAATMADLFDRLSKSPNAASAAIKIFGKEWWDETLRAKGAGAELVKQLQLLRDPKNYRASLDKNLSVELGTTANHLKRLSSLASDVGDRLGRWALPGINNQIEKLIKYADDLKRRQAVVDAGREGQPAPSDPVGVAATEASKGADWLWGRLHDLLIAPLPTQDPSREASTRGVQDAADQDLVVSKKRAEAATLDEQAKQAKGGDRAELRRRAAALRAEADERADDARSTRRAAGAAGGRDMTDVEIGQAAADASVADARRARALEAALSKGSQPNVQLPDGVVTSRQGLRDELAEIRERQRVRMSGVGVTDAAGKPVTEQTRPAAAVPEATSSPPKTDDPGVLQGAVEGIVGLFKRALTGEAKPLSTIGHQSSADDTVKKALGADMSAEGQKAGASYATGLATGAATAEATATGTATSVKGALGVDAAAEGQKVGASYAAGIETGGAAAVAAAAGMAARVKAALGGAGGGTTPAGVGAIRQSFSVPASPAAAVRTASAGEAGGGRRSGAGAGGGGSGGGTTVHVGGITVQGAGDPDRVAKKVGAELASAIDRNRSGALHDGVVG